MSSVTVVTKVKLKAGAFEDFVDIQRRYIAYLKESPSGLVSSRIGRGDGGSTAVQVSVFCSLEAQEKLASDPRFGVHLQDLIPLMDSVESLVFEDVFESV